MSQDTHLYANGADPEPQWQARLAVMASALPYPPTPDLAARWRAGSKVARVLARPAQRPRLSPPRPVALAWALAALVIALAALLAVPAVRAGLIEFLQIGSVRIIFVPSATPTAAPTATLPGPASPVAAATATPRPTPSPSPTPLLSVLDLAGQTTYADAQARVSFTLDLPAYPPDLGRPDAAYVQDLGGPAVMLVWLEPGDPSRVRLALQYLSSSATVDKMLRQDATPAGIETATVNHQLAFWTSGPYVVRTRSGEFVTTRLIGGHVLIWTEGQLTYRLETGLSLAEAVKLAESLGR